MRGTLLRAFAVAGAVALLAIFGAAAQAPAPAPQAPTVPQFTPQQLDQMLAPIALYPDALLIDVLMAATYPLEVVEADRWLSDGKNASLKGDQLVAALKTQSWDPSVKSLVPFPRVLKMMDSRLEWTVRLGEAFLADQAAVMDSIQRLRWRARGSGMLVSSPEAVVTTTVEEITIEPPSPETVYVPVCDPSLVYGTWPYPAYLPDAFPDVFTGVPVGAFGCGWFGAPIIGALWGWNRWNWLQHRIFIERDKVAALNGNRPAAGEGANGNRLPVGEGLNGNRPVVGEAANGNRLPIGEGDWRYDPSYRHRVPTNDPALRARFPLGQKVGRAFLDGPAGAAHEGVTLPDAAAEPSGVHAWPREITPPPRVNRVPPAFESSRSGPEGLIEGERGYSGRMSPRDMARGGFAPADVAPRFAPSTGGPHFAPSGVASHFTPSTAAPQFTPPTGAGIR